MKDATVSPGVWDRRDLREGKKNADISYPCIGIDPMIQYGLE